MNNDLYLFCNLFLTSYLIVKYGNDSRIDNSLIYRLFSVKQICLHNWNASVWLFVLTVIPLDSDFTDFRRSYSKMLTVILFWC